MQASSSQSADTPAEDTTEASKNQTSVWKKSVVQDTHPELPQSVTPVHTYRTLGSSLETQAVSLKLPFFPAVRQAVEAHQDSIAEPKSKTGQILDPLPVGELLKTQRSFQKNWDTEGEFPLSTPLRRNARLP